METITVFWIFFNVFVARVRGVTSVGQTYSGCLDHGDAGGYRLRCPYGYITNVQLTSGVGSCFEKVCLGLTSTLMVAQHQCYWQDQCDVEFPVDVIVKTSEFSKCIARRPGFVEISGYSCFNHKDSPNDSGNSESRLLNICADTDGNPHRTSSSATYARSEGLIRSHTSFPWSYESTERNCSLELPLLSGHRLHVTVHHMDVGEHDSVMVIGTNSKERRSLVNAAPGTALTIGEDWDSSFRFDFNVSVDSNGGSGFVICFKFYKLGDDSGPQNNDVCDELLSKGVLELLPATTQPPTQPPVVGPNPVTCKRKKNGKCRGPKKPKCKKIKDVEARKKCIGARKGRKGKGKSRKKRKGSN
ncbi:uncharacterized protein LOC128239160 [Mya arenaria]|uniref:uncharacterized protein LOC128239160 n=1 Tax=Mya arenaria TaxID=6604 RepID=UPI0022DECA16|nr:uncharacterized protein LOC128239160 [Mya arenaria]